MKPKDIHSGLTQTRLRELLRYDPTTGEFYWRQDRRRVRKGSRAGYLAPAGRRSKPRYMVGIDGNLWFRSRLAWLYMTGSWPADEIDHRDRDSLNDRWENLREATRQSNETNKGAYRNNKLGIKGVVIKGGRAYASIRRHGRRIQLGSFASAEVAGVAYRTADRLISLMVPVSPSGALRG